MSGTAARPARTRRMIRLTLAANYNYVDVPEKRVLFVEALPL